MKKVLALFVLSTALVAAPPAEAQGACGLVPLDTGAVQACTSGAGGVTIVLAAGAGQSSRTWRTIRPELASFARVVTFDRPGLGGSPPGKAPRTPSQIARELHSVLRALEVSGPLILLGHSMGGIHALRYATEFPEGVSGVVILDAPPPDFEARRLTLLSPEEREERQRLLRVGLEDAPEAVRLEREGAQPISEWDFAAFPRALPLYVVVADSQDFGTLGSQSAHRRLWRDGSSAWVDLSSHGELVVAEGSGHMVHHDRPDVVLRVMRDLIARAGEG